MTKLCPRGKAAAKRKFRVYPSAYANAYASKICAGKIKDPSGVKRKDFRGRKPAAAGGTITKGVKEDPKRDQKKQPLKELIKKRKESKQEALERMKKELGLKAGGRAMRGKSGRGPRPEPRSSEERIKSLKPGVKRTRLERGLPPIPGAIKPTKRRSEMMGGGLMEATQRLRRQGLKAGGRGCKLAMKGRGRAYGKNS